MYSKKQIAILLATTPGIMAGNSELLQFFRSPQYDPEEEHEGNYLESFMEFRGYLDADLIDVKEFTIENTFLKGQTQTYPKIPKKIQQKLNIEEENNKKIIEDWDELNLNSL